MYYRIYIGIIIRIVYIMVVLFFLFGNVYRQVDVLKECILITSFDKANLGKNRRVSVTLWHL